MMIPEIAERQRQEVVPAKEREIIVSVRGVSKRFCKDRRASMVYGMLDLAQYCIGKRPNSTTLRQDEFWAVKDVSFELRRGQVLGVIGANGCGKTTLLRLIAGILSPDKGEIRVKGRVASLISLGTGFHPLLTGRENIYLNGTILGLTHGEIDSKIESIIQFSELDDFIDAPISTYSSGMRVRLGFSIAIAVEPDILLLDEVLAVGDQSFKAKCYREMDRLSKNAALIFVSHSMSKITRICTEIMVLSHGVQDYYGKDVRDGIDHYHTHFALDSASVSGVGKAVIRELELSSVRELETTSDDFSVRYLDPLDILVTFSLDPSIRKAKLRLSIFDQEFDEVCATASHWDRFEILNDAGSLTVKVRVPQLLLSPGLYYLTVTLKDAESDVTLVKSHAIRHFRVLGPFNSTAPLQIPAEWSRRQDL